jgi:hypothetical protein
VHRSPRWDTNGFKKGQAAEFVRRRDYSDAEALVLLLEAAKRAIVDTAVMVYDINTLLAELDIHGGELRAEDSDRGIGLNCQVNRGQAQANSAHLRCSFIWLADLLGLLLISLRRTLSL